MAFWQKLSFLASYYVSRRLILILIRILSRLLALLYTCCCHCDRSRVEHPKSAENPEPSRAESRAVVNEQYGDVCGNFELSFMFFQILLLDPVVLCGVRCFVNYYPSVSLVSLITILALLHLRVSTINHPQASIWNDTFWAWTGRLAFLLAQQRKTL